MIEISNRNHFLIKLNYGSISLKLRRVTFLLTRLITVTVEQAWIILSYKALKGHITLTIDNSKFGRVWSTEIHNSLENVTKRGGRAFPFLTWRPSISASHESICDSNSLTYDTRIKSHQKLSKPNVFFAVGQLYAKISTLTIILKIAFCVGGVLKYFLLWRSSQAGTVSKAGQINDKIFPNQRSKAYEVVSRGV